MRKGRFNQLMQRSRQVLFQRAQQHPVFSLLLIGALSNVFGTLFNIAYNLIFILERCTPEQQAIFKQLVMAYNPIAFPVGLGLVLAFVWPIYREHGRILRGEPVVPAALQRCRRALINLPFYLICINSLCWLVGAFTFPAVICWLGGNDRATEIWLQFIVSFGVGMGLTVVQTLFFIEEFLIRVLYPFYFRDARPADVRGGVRLSFFARLGLFWMAVAVMPMVAVFALTFNLGSEVNVEVLRGAFLVTLSGGLLSGCLISLAVGNSLLRWLREHQRASEQIAHGDYATRVTEKRPDEWGKLTDRFNDMAAGLEQAEKERETFGQFVHPEMWQEIIQRYLALGGEVKEVTVMFVDIRGFTRRSAGEPPEKVVALLNQFLTLAVSAIEDDFGGWVNKFLGDGVLALFNIRPWPDADHADRALQAALDLLRRLHLLNENLRQQQLEPLHIGIGIHTGPALVGCVGATISLPDGGTTMRRELTAIGETVNLGQRLEQLTKTLGGPILLSGSTQQQLRGPAQLHPLGPQAIPGYEGTLDVFRVATTEAACDHERMMDSSVIRVSY
jgi:adenylate cyclase